MGLLFASTCLDLVFVAASLGAYLYYRIRKRLDTFKETGVPYIPAKSLFEYNTFGAFTDKSLGELYDDVYWKLSPHKYGGFFNTLRPCIMLRDPVTINKLLTTDFNYFNDHGLPTDEETNPMEANLFFLAGAKWKALRRKLSPTFTSGKLKWMFPLIGDCTDDLVAAISREAASGSCEMSDLLARFTTDVIGTCAFGLEPESIKNPDSKFREMGKRFFKPPLFNLLKGICRFIFPSFFKTFHIPTQPKDVTSFFESLTSQTIAHRMLTGEKRTDFVQMLVQLKEKGSVEADPTDLELEEQHLEDGDDAHVKIEFSDQLLAAQAFVFFIAGFETTASSISFTLFLLAKEKEAQEKARQEVKEVASSNGGRITYDDITKMNYLNACIKESMRIYPPIHVLPRVCTKDYTMEDGRPIKKGTTIFVPIYSLQRDPDFFPSPLEFRPERFMDKESPIPGTYMPFGYGPRICIGQRFALLEACLAVAKILDNFKISIAPEMKMPLRLISKTFVVGIGGGLWLNFEKIKK